MDFKQLLNSAATLGVPPRLSPDDHPKFCNWLQNQFSVHGQRSDLTYLGAMKNQHGNSLVSMAYENDLKTLVVVKRNLHESYILPLNTLYELNTYITLQKNRKNPHLPVIYNVHISESCIDIILEYAPLSFSNLFCQFHAPIEFVEFKIKELIKTVEFLHKNNIAHRDIKSDNLRFQKDSSLMLIDFDSSSCVKHRTTVPAVTLDYRAPEILKMEIHPQENNEKYDAFACDWWSVGCVLAEMVLGDKLFEATNKTTSNEMLITIETFLLKLHTEDDGGPLQRRMPPHLYQLLKSFLTEDPTERMKNIFSKPFLNFFGVKTFF